MKKKLCKWAVLPVKWVILVFCTVLAVIAVSSMNSFSLWAKIRGKKSVPIIKWRELFEMIGEIKEVLD